MFSKISLSLFLATLTVTTWADHHTNFKTVVLEGYYMTGDGSSFSGIASWRPTLYSLNRFDFGLSLGAAPIKQNSDAITSLYEGYASVGYGLTERLKIHLNLGAQYWGGNGEETGILIGSSVNYQLNESLKSKLGFVDFVTAGYSFIDQSDSFHMIRFGVGKSF
jgi:hypothetical protein